MRYSLPHDRYALCFEPTDRTVMHTLARKATAQRLSVAGVGHAQQPPPPPLLVLLSPRTLECNKRWCQGSTAARRGGVGLTGGWLAPLPLLLGNQSGYLTSKLVVPFAIVKPPCDAVPAAATEQTQIRRQQHSVGWSQKLPKMRQKYCACTVRQQETERTPQPACSPCQD